MEPPAFAFIPGRSTKPLHHRRRQEIEAALSLRRDQCIDQNELGDPIRDRGGNTFDNQAAVTEADQHDEGSVSNQRDNLFDSAL